MRAGWVHVGDSLVNDVRASKEVGATTVWLDLPPAETSAFSTASAEEAAERQAAADEALRAGYVDARIESIAELPSALERLTQLRGGGSGSGMPADARRAARDAIGTAGLSAALVGGTCFGARFAEGMLRQASGPRVALQAGLQSAQRWARISATFNGVRTFGVGCDMQEGWSTVAAAMAAGAASAASVHDVPRRAAAYFALALAAEAAGPRLLDGLRMAGTYIEAELATRQEQFARGAAGAAPPSAPSRTSKGLRNKHGGAARPWQRLDAFVDRLNSELGHDIRANGK